MKLVEAIGKRVEDLLHSNKNMTQYQLAKQCGIPRSTVWKIINVDTTRNQTVKIDTIYQIADTFGLSLKEFFDDPIFDEVTD